MMLSYGFCPRCSQRIETERAREAVVVCAACGFVLSNSEHRLAANSHHKFITVGVAFCALLIGALVQISIWDSYWLEVIPLQIKGAMGASKDSDFEKMAQICLERKRMNCAEDAYAHLAKKDPKQLLRLAKFQISRSRYREAVVTYRNFFLLGGKDLDASFNYARALAQIGEYDEASKYFRYILSSHPDAVLQAAAQNGYEKAQRDRRNPSRAPQRGIASVGSPRQ